MKPRTPRWGNPLSKWTNTHSVWARQWLFIVVAFVVIGLIYGLFHPEVKEFIAETFRNYPDTEAMFSAAWEEARDDNPEAKLLAMQILSYSYPLDGEHQYGNYFLFLLDK
jgi:hypothetical protein